ncbi:PGPGW domain-containing protein [Psychrobium sp. MM17-31]|uniref:PGPGW domain-containing protein n=1 Tax=Psychrobium sp. MM17-31 TaxID=2917758 RepID=UPI001EF720F2|nr:PGPGW domain-containing protein [Psychrobium sp. MM17-31]MCG7533274.1 PGPGW domain-containing protein [Psychrobium sp. MM17-31]
MNSLRKTLITLVGGGLLAFGLIFILLPGTVLILPIALAILALEYDWARRWVKVAQKMLTKSAKKMDDFVAKCRRK